MPLPDYSDADILRAAGLTVTELPGWKTRGESDGPFNPIAILLHHDGEGLGFDKDPTNDLNVPEYMSQNGVSGAQKWVERNGVWVMLAAGRKWHAGVGIGWRDIGRDSGNSRMDGVETDHTTGDPWEPVQVASIVLGTAALVQAHGWDSRNCCGHKEYTRDTGRKPDPENFDCDWWRSQLDRPLSELRAEYLAAAGGHGDPTGEDDTVDDKTIAAIGKAAGEAAAAAIVPALIKAFDVPDVKGKDTLTGKVRAAVFDVNALGKDAKGDRTVNRGHWLDYLSDRA